MNWFTLALIAMVCWSGSDFFSKLGSKPGDKYSHWKMVIAVGLIMGLHAGYEIFFNNVYISLDVILTYLPASALYILSMVFGYVSLRYIELSVSSPICNSSGALAAILCVLFLPGEISKEMLGAIILIGVSIVGLGFAEMYEDDNSRAIRQQKSVVKYRKSVLALLLPVLYCLIDAAGTFVDTLILREEPTGTFFDKVFPTVLPENSANVAYELTFLFMGVIAAIYVFVIRREKVQIISRSNEEFDGIVIKRDGMKLLGGICETAGQLAYVFALGNTAHAAPAAAIISAYCALSSVWSTIFLRERLSWKHYVAICGAIVGIVALGFLDP